MFKPPGGIFNGKIPTADFFLTTAAAPAVRCTTTYSSDICRRTVKASVREEFARRLMQSGSLSQRRIVMKVGDDVQVFWFCIMPLY